jgi:hypothetical protein
MATYLDYLTGAGETAATLGSGALAGLLGMPYGVYKGATSGKLGTREANRIAEEEAKRIMQEYTYQPRGQVAPEMLQSLGGLLEASKLPPVIPEAAMLASIPRQAVAAQAERTGMAAERAVTPMVNRTMQRGGFGAGLLGDLAQQPINVLPPKQFRGKALKGLPSKVNVGGTIEEFGTDQRLVDIAKGVTEKKGLVYSPQLKYAEIDPDRATRLANQYELMQNNPSDPKVKKAYNAMIDETLDQYEALRKAGYQFNFMPEGGDIYGNPRNAINDIVMNKRLSVFPTEQGFGGPSAAKALEANPLLMRIGEKWQGKDVTANDVFRAVHDVFGHAKYGSGFRAGGEENAFQAHARMYSPEALPAVTSETRGQNSWVNFGPYGAQNRIANPALTEYAEQKTGIMQPWTWQEGLLNIK